MNSMASHMNSMASPNAPLVGLRRSRSLVLADLGDSGVLQAVPTSTTEVVEVVAEQSWLVTKLTVQLLWAMRMSGRWLLSAWRLMVFAGLLLPPFLAMFFYWLRDPHIHRNVIYGMNGRNLLDVYLPHATSAQLKRGGSTLTPSAPVVVFFTGGAWVIGYKAWGTLIGKFLTRFGVIVVMPDYRNFPQGILPDMVEDATRAMQWVFDNIHLFGGDKDNVTLVGQSAGAHIAMCTLLEQVERKEHEIRAGRRSRSSSLASSSYSSMLSSDFQPVTMTRTMSNSSNISLQSCESVESVLSRTPTWELKQIRSFIGISGPYNIEASLETFHHHGFDKGVVERIMAHQLSYYSPALRLLSKSEHRDGSQALDDFPPVYLLHGTADKTVNCKSSEQLAEALEACNVPVKTQLYAGKTHTDPIIEDYFCGDDFLMNDLLAILKETTPINARTGQPTFEFAELPPETRWYPPLLVHLARLINPF